MALPFCSLPDLSSTDFPQREHPQSVYYDMAPAQRMLERYGSDSMSVSTWQAQSFGRPAVTMQPFGPPTLYSSQKQFHDGFSVNKPPMAIPIVPKIPMMPMVPQKPPRKRKAATLRAADWEPYRKRILELHIEQNRSVHEVKKIMEDEYGFKAEVRQYRSRISQWGQDKNIKRHEMQAIVRKHQKRKLVETDKRPLVFEVRRNEVDRQKIERWMRSYDVSGSFLYRPDPAAPTPPAVGCRTISERGSPAPTAITVYSNPASAMSLDDADATAHNSQMLPPVLSLSGTMQSQTDDLAEETPVLRRQSHPSLQLSFIYDQSDPRNTEDGNVRIVYRRDEEMRLRGDLIIADLTVLSDVPEILLMMYNVGVLFIDQGRYSAAEEVGWRLIDAHRRQLFDGMKTIRMLDAFDLLVGALMHRGAFAKAEVLSRKVLLNTHDLADRSTLLDNIGYLLDAQGMAAEAEAIYRQSLDMREKCFGREHPDTINSAVRLGTLLHKRGRLVEAEAILSKTLVLVEEVSESENYWATLKMGVLMEVLASQIEYKKVEAVCRRILAFKEKEFGHVHLQTISSRGGLSASLRKQHRYTEAEEVDRGTLVLRKQDKYKEAEATYTETLALRKKVLGPEHPHTLQSLEDLQEILERR